MKLFQGGGRAGQSLPKKGLRGHESRPRKLAAMTQGDWGGLKLEDLSTQEKIRLKRKPSDNRELLKGYTYSGEKLHLHAMNRLRREVKRAPWS